MVFIDLISYGVVVACPFVCVRKYSPVTVPNLNYLGRSFERGVSLMLIANHFTVCMSCIYETWGQFTE